jgi:GTPase SAR1 family protein
MANTIRRKSLGRSAFIGSLYNAASDTFCGTTIFRSECPNDSVRSADIPHAEILYEYKDTYKEKFNKLDVEAELKLSVLAGLFTLGGSGKYLNDVKDSLRSVKGTLIYKMTSVEENWDIHRDDIKSCISTDGFSNNQNATHVVIGIKWGAAIMASFECKDTNEENKSQVEGALKCHFEKITISGEGDVNVEEEGHSNISHFSIKLLGDVVPNNKELPQSFDEAKKVIAELPLYTKQYNGGKGVQIEYTLYPLSELAKLLTQNVTIDNMITELSEETVLRVEQVFDGLSESKQKLNDLYDDAQSISDLIPDKDFDQISSRVKEVGINEAKFRHELADCLVKVRSGKCNFGELENKLKIFQEGNLSKASIMKFIQQHRLVSTLAELVLILKAKKVEYLGKNSTIEHILNKYSTNDVYILFDSDDKYVIDGNSSPVHSVFRDLYNSDEGSSKFFIVNLKICTQIECLNYPTIQHYINGKLSSNNFYDDNMVLFTSNLVKFHPVPNIKPKNDPSEKTRLVVPCPQDCPTIDCNWRCFRCKQNVEYGYNQHLYCECGESNIAHSKFKCSSPHHTKGYTPFDSNKLDDLLPLAPPQEEINILLLGETGVGKSTFINSFANYLKFNTLNNAKYGDMEVLIPSEFTITDENYETTTIRLGNYDLNEQLDVGESSTRECKSYVFHSAENKLVRLIDTPGIGDTKGCDKKNFENILWYINYYRYLNGICILLKPNNARLNVVFKYCIQELLSHLHKNAKDNIVFCFTNARQTHYRPGDTLPPLKKQLEDLKRQSKSGVEIKVHKDTMYCFDSESFRFLAAIKKNIKFPDSEEQSFAESWERSVNESLRLIEYLVKRQPHAVEDTLSLNNSRSIVILLSKPLAEIERLIQQNIILIKEKQEEINNSDKTIEELRGKLYVPQMDIVPVKLGYPRTVCTNSNCVKISPVSNNVKTIDYVKHCCSHCLLRFSRYNVVNNRVLMFCSAIKLKNGKCKVCGCKWNEHMHITYENKYIVSDIVDKNIELQISEQRSDQETKRAIIEEHQRRDDQLRKEQEKIKEISLKFAQFLRQNAIAAFNDAYADYLDLFIKGEKIKRNANPSHYDDRVLRGLETTRDTYLKQVEIIKQAIENNDSSKPPITPEEITELEQQLYNLPINGQTIKRLKDETERSQTDVFRYTENHYMPSTSNKGNFKSNPFAKIFGKGW